MGKLLMPEEAPNGYGGSNSMFPAAPPGSLRLLGYVRLSVPDMSSARLFFLEGLGAGVCRAQPGDAAVLNIQVGASQFLVSESVTASQLAFGWPGHFYIWVDDIRRTLEACQALSKRLGVELIEDLRTGVHSVDSIDALTVTDPSQRYRFAINQAPKALGRRMRTRAMPLGADPTHIVVSSSGCCRRRDTGKQTHLLGILEAVRLVKPGTADQIVSFYADFLGAAVDKTANGLAVHFSLGGALSQMLVFAEDETIDDSDSNGADELDAICMYLPSKDAFQTAFRKCHEVGILVDDLPWEKAESACEFQFKRILDPVSKRAVLDLRHSIRFPDHPEFPPRPAKKL